MECLAKVYLVVVTKLTPLRSGLPPMAILRIVVDEKLHIREAISAEGIKKEWWLKIVKTLVVPPDHRVIDHYDAADLQHVNDIRYCHSHVIYVIERAEIQYCI